MYNQGVMSTPKLCLVVLGVALSVVSVALPGAAQDAAQAPEVPVEEIIRRFAEKEKEFKLARENYSYRQEVKVQELSDSDRVRGEYQTISEIAFDDKGNRTERLIYAPPSTLDRISMTAEDQENIRSIQPFVLTSDDIQKYDLKYQGKETIDEVTCYVFDVSPKKIEKGERYFEGKIWVDDLDFQIVKTYGKPVPDIRSKDGNENLFPRFETYREPIDGYWFPTYTRAVDTLDFSSGRVKIRQIVRYGDYKKFEATVKLRFGGEVTDESTGPSDAPSEDVTAPALPPRYQEPQKK